jgi:hypothetical protein
MSRCGASRKGIVAGWKVGRSRLYGEFLAPKATITCVAGQPPLELLTQTIRGQPQYHATGGLPSYLSSHPAPFKSKIRALMENPS